MRKMKDKNIENWNAQQLRAVLKKKRAPEEKKEAVRKILARWRINAIWAKENFFSIETNWFLKLAMWQLYREKKVKVYTVGNQKRFDLINHSTEQKLMLFDKMNEVKVAYFQWVEEGKPNALFNEEVEDEGNDNVFFNMASREQQV